MSNFWPCEVTLPAENIVVASTNVKLDALECGSTEQAYMAWKTIDPELRRKVRDLSSGDASLAEGNTWGDRFFGLDLKTGQGENYLGRILMQVRDNVRGDAGLKPVAPEQDRGVFLDKAKGFGMIVRS